MLGRGRQLGAQVGTQRREAYTQHQAEEDEAGECAAADSHSAELAPLCGLVVVRRATAAEHTLAAGGARGVGALVAAEARANPAGAAAGIEAALGTVEAGNDVEQFLGAAVEALGRAAIARRLARERLDLANRALGADALACHL